MTAMLLAALLYAPPIQDSVTRDNYGVPYIKANMPAKAYYLAGMAVAQDRMWQLERSRHLARGRLAELIGPSGLNSDKQILGQGYSDAELQQMIDGLSPEMKLMFENYANGINAAMRSAVSKGTLPPEYKLNDLTPEPWTVLDSAAITVWMARLFGSGAAGELRNFALIQYLNGQKNAKDRVLDVFDDLAWQNDKSSPTTLLDSDDPQAKNPPSFPNPTREQSQFHLSVLPKTGLMELLPGIRMASMEDSKLIASKQSVIHKTGSYAIVVGKSKSATGEPLLLSGPQMGHQVPTVIHEIVMETSLWKVSGMGVPGIPGVLIGHTNDIAWGLTSGVADIEDIFFMPRAADNKTNIGGKILPLIQDQLTIKVKGGDDVKFTRSRTPYGPVVLDSVASESVYAQKRSYWGNELKSLTMIHSLYRLKSGKDIIKASYSNDLTFNLFFATKGGDIGWRFCGKVPIRAEGIDPRLPTPATPKYEWKGFLPPEKNPYVLNPKSGMLYNWNNKPVSWWPNGDTPVWGRYFRSQQLGRQLEKSKLTASDMKKAIFNIARLDEGYSDDLLKPLKQMAMRVKIGDPVKMAALTQLMNYKGDQTIGSLGSSLFAAYEEGLRVHTMGKVTGNFLSAEFMNRVIQPSVLGNILERKTKVDYIADGAEGAAWSAFEYAFEKLSKRSKDPASWTTPDDSFPVVGGRVPYSDRGTYIQIITLGKKGVTGESSMPPGNAESGPHSNDQAELARDWKYKAKQ